MPKISVIVPVYNVENKLVRCVDSILAQDFDDFEILLIDDGSLDNSGSICDEYEKKHARIKAVHQTNQGVSSARNTGIKKAESEYICFVDSDDYVEPGYLKTLYEGILKNKQLSVCGVYYCRDGVETKTAQKIFENCEIDLKAENTEFICDLLENGRFNYVYAKLYNCDIIKKYSVLFNTDVSLGEDTVFVMDYMKHINSVNIIGASYYNYIRYEGNNSLTTRFRRDIYPCYLYVSKQIEKFFFEKGIWNSLVQTIVDKRNIESAIWSTESIIYNNRIKKSEKEELINDIINSEELIVSLSRNSKAFNNYECINAISSKSAKKVIGYYKSRDRKQAFSRAIRIAVVKIVPNVVIKKVKSWLRIAQ